MALLPFHPRLPVRSNLLTSPPTLPPFPSSLPPFPPFPLMAVRETKARIWKGNNSVHSLVFFFLSWFFSYSIVVTQPPFIHLSSLSLWSLISIPTHIIISLSLPPSLPSSLHSCFTTPRGDSGDDGRAPRMSPRPTTLSYPSLPPSLPPSSTTPQGNYEGDGRAPHIRHRPTIRSC